MGPLLLTWINFDHMPSKVWNQITYPFPNFNGATVDVWEWISDLIPHFIMDVITYPCKDKKLVHVSIRGPRPPWDEATIRHWAGAPFTDMDW